MVSIRIISIANFLRVFNAAFGTSVLDRLIDFDIMGAVEEGFQSMKDLGTDEARFKDVLSTLFQAGAIDWAVGNMPFKKSVTMFGVTIGL